MKYFRCPKTDLRLIQPGRIDSHISRFLSRLYNINMKNGNISKGIQGWLYLSS